MYDTRCTTACDDPAVTLDGLRSIQDAMPEPLAPYRIVTTPEGLEKIRSECDDGLGSTPIPFAGSVFAFSGVHVEVRADRQSAIDAVCDFASKGERVTLYLPPVDWSIS